MRYAMPAGASGNCARRLISFNFSGKNDNITGCKAKFLIEKKKEKVQIVQ